MSVRRDAALARERKLHQRTSSAALKAGPQFKAGASLRTRQRAAERWRKLASKFAESDDDIKSVMRAYLEVADIVLEQFPTAEFDDMSVPDLMPAALKRLHEKALRLEVENAALRKQLMRNAADSVSTAYKQSR